MSIVYGIIVLAIIAIIWDLANSSPVYDSGYYDDGTA